jgi:hypothetical protein
MYEVKARDLSAAEYGARDKNRELYIDGVEERDCTITKWELESHGRAQCEQYTVQLFGERSYDYTSVQSGNKRSYSCAEWKERL